MNALFPFGYRGNLPYTIFALLACAAIYTALFRLIAKLFKNTQLAWLHALALVAVFFAVEDVRQRVMRAVTDSAPPVLVQIAISALLLIPTLTWLTRRWAKSESGERLSLRDCAILATLYFVTTEVSIIFVARFIRGFRNVFF